MIAHNELVAVFFLDNFQPPVGQCTVSRHGQSGFPGVVAMPGLLVVVEEDASESCLFRLRGETLDSASMRYFFLVG